MNKTLIVIAGPTAVGKTDLSLEIAEYFQTEIISADSRQCYQEMNIGTAKPSVEELQRVKHHFIHTHSIHEEISAADFERMALTYIKDIFELKDIAILSGGTGLYIDAVCDGIEEMPPINPHIEREIRKSYEKNGLEWLQQTLAQEDPLFFNQSQEINNPHRLLRAVVFKKSIGKSISLFRTGAKKKRDFKIIKIGLELPRAELYERINQRVDLMMEKGLLEEAKSLFPFKNLKNLQTVGYAELFEYFEGKVSLENAVERIKQHTRHYAKRQMTWFKKDENITWFHPRSKSEIIKYLKDCI